MAGLRACSQHYASDRAGYDFKRLFTISEYYDRDRTAFYRALQGVREQNMDLTGWPGVFCERTANPA